MNMKKIIAVAALSLLPFSNAMADQDIGCGLGSMLFAGQQGKGVKILGATTNGTSGNQTFGITFGTLGCDGTGTVTSSEKIALFIVVAASLAACTKWENKSTEFKVTGVWTGINTQIEIKALPFLDSTDLQNTTFMEANFMENGGLTIDSAGARMDSLGWAIKNDTILVLKGLDLGIELPGGGGGVGSSDMNFVIRTLEQDAFTFRTDTNLTVTVPGVPIPLSIDIAQIQRWGK